VSGVVSKRRVVVTGVGLASPIGNSLDAVTSSLIEKRHGIVKMPQWANIGQLQARLAGCVQGVEVSDFPRKKVRTMGRVGLLSVYATEQAVKDAGLNESQVSNLRTGMAYGSTHGSSTELETFCRTLFDGESLAGLAGSTYLKFMSHTCAANLAQYYGIRGRVVPTVAACASASQGIGLGYEAVAFGQQEIMLCGGAEEMHFVHAGVFDIVFAASSKYNDRPELTPRPYDADRDGLVVAEGAGTLVLEEYEHAKARGAHIYAEILGYGTCCDGTHVTSPSVDGMAHAMELALQDARLAGDAIEYVNAHGTGTEVGDIAESHATLRVLGPKVPVSSTKSYTGHTLGACGAIEAAFCFAAMRESFLPTNRNLEKLDERCAQLDFITGDHRAKKPDIVMSNNFAFGGINTSLIFKRV
jgi:3-oxoacyl-[acyl-carrier-protein] synthase II